MLVVVVRVGAGQGWTAVAEAGTAVSSSAPAAASTPRVRRNIASPIEG
ncbi:hypothetical protein ACFQ0B_01980 [Nonomuraea thailandensis]